MIYQELYHGLGYLTKTFLHTNNSLTDAVKGISDQRSFTKYKKPQSHFTKKLDGITKTYCKLVFHKKPPYTRL